MIRLRMLLPLLMLLPGPMFEMRAQTVDRINICHIEERVGDELIGTVISIPVQAWPGHQRHFDFEANGGTVGDGCRVIN